MRINAVPPQAPAYVSGPAVAPVQPAAPVEKREAQRRAQGGPDKAPPTGLNVPSLDALVAIGAMEGDRERRRRQAAGLFQGVALLEDLHRELASGAVPAQRLDQLAEWLASAEEPSHPRLVELMRDIALRVAVELAKMGR